MTEDILLPMCAMAALTFAVLITVPLMRFASVARREVTAGDFALGESARVPDRVRLPTRNLANLFEMPVLFYVLCLALFVSGHVTPLQVTLAWTYVGLRTAHSLVHITINHVPLRLVVFAASSVTLTIMWAMFTVAVMR